MEHPTPYEFLPLIKTLLEKHKADWKRVAYYANVSVPWLNLIASEKIDNPGFLTLLRTYQALTVIEREADSTPTAQ